MPRPVKTHRPPRAASRALTSSEQDALARVYETQFPRVVRYLRRSFLLDAATAEDTASHCFTLIIQGNPTERAKFLTNPPEQQARYLFTLARWRGIEHKRAATSAHRTPLSLDADTPLAAMLQEHLLAGDEWGDPERVAAFHETCRELGALIADLHLSPRLQQVAALIAQGATLDDIAAAQPTHGTQPHNAAKMAVYRVRDRLRPHVSKFT